LEAVRGRIGIVSILTLIAILVGGATSRFYAYREPSALTLLITHLTIALIAYGVIIYKLYQYYRSQRGKPVLMTPFTLFSIQLGLGTLLALYRLGFFTLDLMGELSFTGLHFLIALILLIILVQIE